MPAWCRPCAKCLRSRRSWGCRGLLSVRLLAALRVVPLVFRAPEGPAAREARRPHFVRRRASKPARTLRSLRRPPHQWGWVAVVWFGASGSEARSVVLV